MLLFPGTSSLPFSSAKSILLFACTTIVLTSPTVARAQQFSLYAYAFMNSEQHPSIQVNATLPYNSLIFFKRNDVYESTFELYLRLMDKEGNLVDTAVLKRNVSVPRYSETKSTKQSAKLSKQFTVVPGSYTLEAAVAVRNTQLREVKTVVIEVPDFLASGIGIGTPRLYAVPRQLLEQLGPLVSASRIPESDLLEIESSSFASIERVPALRLEIYTEAGDSKHLSGTLYVEVIDSRKNQLFYNATALELRGRGDASIVLFDVDDWELGGYRMNIRVVMTEPHREAVASREFTIGFTRAMLDRYFDDTLDMLSIIASKDELHELESAAVERRAQAWTHFWQRRDPSPGTDTNESLVQFLARIQYITENFSKVGPAWRTDRGKIYLRFGPPDEIESTIDSVAQGEYLIWRYYEMNRVFVFYDRFFGVGDFRLISTNAY